MINSDFKLNLNYRNILNKNFIFRDLEIKEVNEILNKYKWEIKKFNKYEIEFDEQFFLKNLNVILEGSIKIVKTMENGKEILYDIVETGNVFGFASIYTNIKIEGLQAQALEKTSIFTIEYSEFKKMMFEKEALFKKFMEFQEYRLYFFIGRFENTFINEPYEKLIYFFDFLKKWNIYEIGMQKIQLANYLNIGRATLYRELKKMKKENIIDIIDKKIIIK